MFGMLLSSSKSGVPQKFLNVEIAPNPIATVPICHAENRRRNEIVGQETGCLPPGKTWNLQGISQLWKILGGEVGNSHCSFV